MSVKIQCKCDLEKIVKDRNIVVWGAGKMGKTAIDEVEKIQGNLNNIIAILDNDKQKHGTNYKGVKVISMENGLEEFKPCALLIAVKSYWGVLEQLNRRQEFDGWDCYIYPLVKAGWIWESDEDRQYHERISRYALLQYGVNLRLKNVQNREELIEAKKAELQTHSKHIVPKMGFIVTNRCTLRCAGCLGRVPYFKNPEDMPVDDVLQDMELFLECIDECITVEITGGEPLLYPHLDVLLKYLIQQDKVLGIALTTNGTVVPGEETLKYMANDKVWVGISDYGMLDKLAKLVYTFERKGVHFEIYSHMKWTDPGNIEKRNKTKELLREEYANCWDAFNCKVIVDGRLFVCPRYARLYMQNIHNFAKDSVSIRELTDLEERRKAIYSLYMLDYADSCDYCNFGSTERKMMKPGEQISSQFYQSQYTLVKRENF